MLHVAAGLRALGTFWVFVLVPCALTVVIVLLPFLREKFGIAVRKETSDGATDTINAITGFMAFVLAISLVQLQSYQRQADDLVSREASKINLLDRSLSRAESTHAAALRPILKEYLEAIIEKEWRSLQEQKLSPEVDRLSGQLFTAASSIKGEGPAGESTFRMVSSTLDELSDLRDARLAAARNHLAEVYWDIVAGLLILILAISVFAPASVDKRLGLGGRMFAIGLMIGLVLLTEGVFEGDISVDSRAMEDTLRLITARS